MSRAPHHQRNAHVEHYVGDADTSTATLTLTSSTTSETQTPSTTSETRTSSTTSQTLTSSTTSKTQTSSTRDGHAQHVLAGRDPVLHVADAGAVDVQRDGVLPRGDPDDGGPGAAGHLHRGRDDVAHAAGFGRDDCDRACALVASGATTWRAFRTNGTPALRVAVGDTITLRRCPRSGGQTCLSVDTKGSIPYIYAATCQANRAARDLSPNWATRPATQRFQVIASASSTNQYRLRASDGRCIGIDAQGKLLLVACRSAASFTFPRAPSQTC
ncbi:hypothetical protein DFJ74DRAFT_714235 [Hyaloraphidium curvatum]|nr:hypothetical protein DFJ74DRAFT_714235 [Hyaloraphidium curvatum]